MVDKQAQAPKIDVNDSVINLFYFRNPNSNRSAGAALTRDSVRGYRVGFSIFQGKEIIHQSISVKTFKAMAVLVNTQERYFREWVEGGSDGK